MWNTVGFQRRVAALALAASITGCTAVSDCKYEVGQKIRTSQAWHEFDGCNDECFTSDYRNGWKAGFYNVITGGDGRPPVIPPKKYWKPPVFVEHDPSRKDDWYAGFQDGACCGKSQPDHHFLPTFLPDAHVAHEVHSHPHHDAQFLQGETIGEPYMAPESEMPSQSGPMTTPESPGAVQPETAPGSPAEPPKSATEQDYEKDPEPSTSSAQPVKQPGLAAVSYETEASPSLLRQLVLNASQEDSQISTNNE
jgi:hypothetical protein